MNDGGIGGAPCFVAVIVNDIGGGVLIMLLMLVEQTTKRDSIGSANGCCNDDGSLCNLHDDDGVGRQCDLLLQNEVDDLRRCCKL